MRCNEDEDNKKDLREEKAFTMWINSLGLTNELGESIYVNNLYEDTKNGLLLLEILDKIKPGVVNWKIVDKKPNNRYNITVNCNEVIDAGERLKLGILGIGGGDIRDGKKKYILKIVWEIMKADILSKIGYKTEEELISWGNERVNKDLKISSLKDKSLGNSLYFINIMQSISPNSINWNKVTKNKDDYESKKNNAIYAISIARKLGVTIFLDWEDIVEVNLRLLFTFLASLYQYLFLKNPNDKTNIDPKKIEPYITKINSSEETSIKEISKLKIELDNEKNNNKELIKKINKLEKELNEEKNKNKILEKNISNLKNELKKNKTEVEKIGNKNLENNSKESLYESIMEKDKEIKNLKLKLSRYPVDLNEGEELMSIIFISVDQKLNCSIICKNTDKFNIVENKLYDYYSELAENENYFTFNGIKINKYKTLEENNIKNNNIILLNKFD